MAKSGDCPKCGGAMVQGFMADMTYGGASVASWREGPPKKRWWGLALGGTPVEVSTLRCKRCGYLENYAN